MDRDIAVNLLGKLKNYKDKIEEINDNKYVPHITQQPVDFTGAIGVTATFTVVANNVKSYQWQWKPADGIGWNSTTVPGNRTDTITVEVTQARYSYLYRCKIIGLDGSEIYSDVVKLIEPET